MPIASPEVYAEMLDRAKAGAFAYPAINVTSSQTLNAALRGFAEAGSDGIVQVSTGGAEYLSGSTVKDMVAGAVALAAYAHEIAKNYPVNIALHTDHCPKDKLDGYVRPLLAISKERVANASSTVEYNFSSMAPTMPSSSPPTTPTSISSTMCAWAASSSRSAAMSRFSSSGTAEPSHMCDWNSGPSPRATRSLEISSSGRT